MKTISDLRLPKDIEEHSIRVRKLCEIIAREMKNIDASIVIDIEALKQAAEYHDTGKIKIPKHILHKPSNFTIRERHIMNQHVKFSAYLGYKYELDPKVVKMILRHHERCDGSGYPFGIKVTDIETKILMIADVFDALISDRPYRKGFSFEKALMEIEKEKEKYDPMVLKCFLNIDFGSISYLEIA